jgi:biotin-dependent carboxylase-like uncharacterized protein
MTGLRVVHPGALTTVQDLGRYGYQSMGLSPSGVLDDYSFRMGNVVLGNDPKAAAVEMVLWAPTLEVTVKTAVALVGGEVRAFINGEEAPMWEALLVEPGDLIEVKEFKTGFASYICVAGGVAVPPVLGSRSTDILGMMGGLEGGVVKKDSVLPVGTPLVPLRELAGRRLGPAYIPDFSGEATVRVIMGPQDDYFTGNGIQTLLTTPYTVSMKSDRMGLRLEGEVIEHGKGADIFSEGITVGAIQVPKNGLPIVLLAGRQTVGGYTKIAVVASVDIHRAAQRRPGDTLRFSATGVDEARGLLLEREALFQKGAALLE